MVAEQKIGFDTGFFIRLLAGKDTAISVYEKLTSGEIIGFVSVIVIFELKRLALQGIIDREAYELLESNWKTLFEIIPIDYDLAIEASSISHGTGLHASDALIFTSCKKAGCSLIYTTDRAFEIAQSKKIKIVLI